MLATLETTSPAGSPAHLVAGILAHLSAHFESGCPRAARLAALLLDHLAADGDTDANLRQHAAELAETLHHTEARAA